MACDSARHRYSQLEKFLNREMTKMRKKGKKYIDILLEEFDEKEENKRVFAQTVSLPERSAHIGIFDDDGNLEYRYFCNCIFWPTNRSSLRRKRRMKLLTAIQFSPKIVFDFSYDSMLTSKSHIKVIRQLSLAFGVNIDFPEGWFLCFNFIYK